MGKVEEYSLIVVSSVHVGVHAETLVTPTIWDQSLLYGRSSSHTAIARAPLDPLHSKQSVSGLGGRMSAGVVWLISTAALWAICNNSV